jgi:hypothetical protein
MTGRMLCERLASSLLLKSFGSIGRICHDQGTVWCLFCICICALSCVSVIAFAAVADDV